MWGGRRCPQGTAGWGETGRTSLPTMWGGQAFTSPPCGEVGAARRAPPGGAKRARKLLLTPSVGGHRRVQDAASVHSPTTDRARYLRNHMSKVEWYVWSRLRNRRLGGYKFRRQVPIGPYFADFACLAARLVVEVDGEGHTQESDELKTAYLHSRGYRVLRVPVGDVDESIDEVMDGVFLALRVEAELDSPHPAAPALRAEPTSPHGGEVNLDPRPPPARFARHLPAWRGGQGR